MRLVPALFFAMCLPVCYGQAPLLIWLSSPVALSVEAGATAPIITRITLNNYGAVTSYQAACDQSWMAITPASGTIAAGSTQDFTLTVYPAQMAGGVAKGKITVTPPPGTGATVATLDVTVQVQTLTFVFTPPSLEFGAGPETTESKSVLITLSDSTVRPIAASVVIQNGSPNWLSFTAPSPLNSNDTIQVRVSATGLEPGATLQGEIRFTGVTVPGMSGKIPVTLKVGQQGARISAIPSQLNFYVFGTMVPPQQPVQVISPQGRISFDAIPSAGSTPVDISLSEGVTPVFFQVRVNPFNAPTLPREDSITIAPRDGSPSVLVPVKTMLEPARVNAIPQVADGGGFKTSITVVNSDSVPAVVSLRFYRSDPATRTTTAWNPPMEGNAPLEQITIPAGSSWTVQTSGAAVSISSGWGEVVSYQVISGSAVFRQVQPDGRIQEAAVPINSSLMQRNLLPFDNTNGYVTSLAIANLSSAEISRVRVAFRDPSGQVIRVDRLKDLPARGHTAFELAREFPYLQGLSGTADFWASDGYISMLGLRFSPSGAFTSFEAQSLNRRPTGRKSIPQVADGGEFRTAITLVNNDAPTAQVQLKFWRSTTNNATEPWTIGFEDGVNPDLISIPAGSSVTIRTSGVSPTVQSGWAEVVSGQQVTGFAVFRRALPGTPAQEAAVPVNVGTPSRLSLPFDNTGGFTTSVAMANLSASSTAQVNLNFRDERGQRLLGIALPELPVQGHRAIALTELSKDLAGKAGTMEISAPSGEISVLGLRFSPTGAYTSFRAQPVQ